MAFGLLTIAFFAGYSNFGIPQIEPAPPPKEEQLDLGAMTMDQFVALGEKLFTGKGTCTLCHNELGRAPMLDKMGNVAAERIADSRYQGEAQTIEAYLYESLLEPSEFVVAGFGKAGTGDTESPMPDVSGALIRLSAAEVTAVVAYLQDQSGIDVTVEIPTEVTANDEKTPEARTPVTERTAATTPQAVLMQYTCTACHKVGDDGGALGPDLSRIGAQRDEASIRRSILNPNAEIVEGFVPMMPPNYGEQMYARELEMLVEYLAGLK